MESSGAGCFESFLGLLSVMTQWPAESGCSLQQSAVTPLQHHLKKSTCCYRLLCQTHVILYSMVLEGCEPTDSWKCNRHWQSHLQDNHAAGQQMWSSLEDEKQSAGVSIWNDCLSRFTARLMPRKERTEAEEYLLQEGMRVEIPPDKKVPFQQEKFSVLHWQAKKGAGIQI